MPSILQSLGVGAEMMWAKIKDLSILIKNENSIKEAIQYYKSTQLSSDLPIQELIDGCEQFRAHIEESLT